MQRELVVHAVLLKGESPLEEALEVLRQGLGADFLVLPTGRPAGRTEGFKLLGLLEALLEATTGWGVKVALHLEPGAETAVLDLLRQARGEAIGFCWHPGIEAAEDLADRLWCGICEPGTDLGPLQVLGYRWDMALAAAAPETFCAEVAQLEVRHPPVLFPAELPATVMGRPVVPDEGVVYGRPWGQEGDRP